MLDVFSSKLPFGLQTGCFFLPNRRRDISHLTSTNTGNDSKNAKNPCPTLHTLNDTGITLLSAAIR